MFRTGLREAVGLSRSPVFRRISEAEGSSPVLRSRRLPRLGKCRHALVQLSKQIAPVQILVRDLEPPLQNRLLNGKLTLLVRPIALF